MRWKEVDNVRYGDRVKLFGLAISREGKTERHAGNATPSFRIRGVYLVAAKHALARHATAMRSRCVWQRDACRYARNARADAIEPLSPSRGIITRSPSAR